MADVVSTGEAFSSTGARREVWPTPVEVAVGTALVSAAGKSGVAYTNSGGFTRTDANSAAPSQITGIPAGGVGLDALKVSVATDGSYEYAVTGATSATPNGTPVYATGPTGTPAVGRITALTTTAGSTPMWGTVNNPTDYVAASGVACVKIGG